MRDSAAENKKGGLEALPRSNDENNAAREFDCDKEEGFKPSRVQTDRARRRAANPPAFKHEGRVLARRLLTTRRRAQGPPEFKQQ